MSGVGKGVASASIGAILQSRGFKVTAIKIDPYVNVDAGTMNPVEHGEVFVLNDGTECDQDLGNYERFLGRDLTSANYMTTGSVYLSVINKERQLYYGGKCVEVVPHIPLEVIDRINRAAKLADAEIAIVEIGGTVGEYQNILFLEAIRMLKLKDPKSVVLALISYLPFLNKDSELKTKPTQYAVRTLNSAGLQPDIIIARASVPIDQKRREKISFNCNIQTEDVISAPDAESIYDIPINFENDNISGRLLKKLNLRPRRKDLKEFRRLSREIHSAAKTVHIGVVGKYFGSGDYVLADSYISVIEAVKHAAYALKAKPLIEWVDAENPGNLDRFDGIIVPGGFGARGVEGKIKTIKYCRERKIPFFGLCYGMQLAVVELSRSRLGWKAANTVEVDSKTKYPVIDVMPEQKQKIAAKEMGGSMRLGAYPAKLQPGTIAYKAYGKKEISERHRHRYEVNPEYIADLQKAGVVFSGTSPDGRLMEIMELSKKVHPFFLGTQFHPEFTSNPMRPHPLFLEFIKASLSKRR